MTKNEIHEGIIDLILTCNNPDDSNYDSGDYLDYDFLEKHNLKPGDKIQYKLDNETDKVIILGKIQTTKTILPVEIKN